jgi:hypothetical protein
VFQDPNLSFWYLPIDRILKTLLGDDSIAKHVVWNCTKEEDDQRARVYSSFSSAKWMEHAVEWVKSKCSIDTKPLIFALGSDATTMVKWGTRAFHPIYLWLLNTTNDIEVNLTITQLVFSQILSDNDLCWIHSNTEKGACIERSSIS